MNRLADETSPYLRQHQDNPVDWYPWGPEAFAAANERNVPILLQLLFWYLVFTEVLPPALEPVTLGPFFLSKSGFHRRAWCWTGKSDD